MPSKRTQRRKRIHNEAISLWRQAVIDEQGEQCIICGRSDIQIHHMFPKGTYGHLKYDPDNGVVLCQGHHFRWEDAKDPIVPEKIKERLGEDWYKNLKEKALNPPPDCYNASGKPRWNTDGWIKEQRDKLKRL